MKTIAQAAVGYVTHDRPHKGEVAAFMSGAAFAQRWIPVEEDLPDNKFEMQLFLVKQNNNYIGLCAYYRYNIFWDVYCRDIPNVTHWRPVDFE